jgi:hypothetical protein
MVAMALENVGSVHRWEKSNVEHVAKRHQQGTAPNAKIAEIAALFINACG